MRSLRGMGFASVLVAITACSTSSPSVNITGAIVDELVKQTVGPGDHVALVIGIIRDGREQIFTYGSTQRNSRVPPDSETVFAIGSVTKVFTTALFTEMVRQRIVEPDDPVRKYLPETMSVPSRNGKEITLLHLAMHTSGLPPLPDDFDTKVKDQNNPYASITPKDIYEFLSAYELKRNPGQKYEYSNLGMGLLGHALARKSGTTYEEAIRTRLLTPLGMEETAITLPAKQRERLAAGHHPDGKPAVHWDIPEIFAGAGALRSNARDMLKFLSANLCLTNTGLEGVLEDCHQARLYTGEGMEIGLGWHVSLLMNSQLKGVFHDGATYAHSAFLGFVKDRKAGVFVLANVGPGIEESGAGCSLLGLMLLSALVQ